MFKGFKEFIMRGNVVDLAVAVVIGAAFGTVVSAFATDFIGGLLGALGGTPNFDSLGWKVNGSTIVIGTTITALIYFLIVAAAIYFLIVLPMNMLAERRKRGQEPEPQAPAEDVLLLQEIRDILAARGGETSRQI